jgi:hypothetical protein
LTKAQRELDRERTKLEQSEKKLIVDIKKSAKAGQLVRFDLHQGSCRINAVQFTECMQSNGKGSCPNASLCSQVLPNAYAAASRQLANTNFEKQPTDGRSDAWRH